MAILPLRELPDYRLADPVQDIRGLPLFDATGERLGTVVELKVDTLSDEVEVAVLDNGRAFSIRRLERAGQELRLRV
jgi:sporulation protein YlmC with PRC-barrel domain